MGALQRVAGGEKALERWPGRSLGSQARDERKFLSVSVIHASEQPEVHEHYDAHARKDVAAILEWLSSNVEVYQSEFVPWGGRYRGKEEVKGFAKGLFEKLTQHIDSRVDVEELVEAGVSWH